MARQRGMQKVAPVDAFPPVAHQNEEFMPRREVKHQATWHAAE